MKRILGYILAAAILMTACSVLLSGCSNSVEDLEDFEVIDAEKLPSKVDLRDYNGKNYVTPVKTQRFGDCWAFSLAGAAEISYLFSHDMGVPAGEENKQVDFSEKYITWYLFHGITKDDVVKGKVRASQVGEGFDPSAAESKFEMAPYVIGGPFVHDANFFSAGFGPVDESVEVNGEYPYAYDDSWEGEWTLPLNAQYRNAPTCGFLKESKKLQSPATFDKDGNYSLNTNGLNAIKSELNQGHGVSIALCSTHGGFNVKTRAAYCSENKDPDHAVTVVGYDDDYPKENFTNKNYSGEIEEDSIPPENGALIIKNSWGLTTFDGDIDDGFLYISYYDRSLMDPLSYVFDSEKNNSRPARNIDQYDLMMTIWYGCTEHDTETKTANVFDAEDDESLYQIAYATGSEKTEVTYEIYKDIKDDDPSSGTLLETGVHRHTFEGFYQIDLKKEYTLKKGEKYAVVLTMKHISDDRDPVYTEVFPYSTEFFEGMSVTGIINQGESYLYSDGKWSDLSAMKDSLTQTAYQYCKEVLQSDPSLPELKLKGTDSMAVDNYPIKAISAPIKE